MSVRGGMSSHTSNINGSSWGLAFSNKMEIIVSPMSNIRVQPSSVNNRLKPFNWSLLDIRIRVKNGQFAAREVSMLKIPEVAQNDGYIENPPYAN